MQALYNNSKPFRKRKTSLNNSVSIKLTVSALIYTPSKRIDKRKKKTANKESKFTISKTQHLGYKKELEKGYKKEQ